MGLNIKNERTHALVRELANRTGQSQTSAVEDAVRARLAELDAAEQKASNSARSIERYAALTEIVAQWRSQLSDAQLAKLRTADGELYDENGLPR